MPSTSSRRAQDARQDRHRRLPEARPGARPAAQPAAALCRPVRGRPAVAARGDPDLFLPGAFGVARGDQHRRPARRHRGARARPRRRDRHLGICARGRDRRRRPGLDQRRHLQALEVHRRRRLHRPGRTTGSATAAAARRSRPRARPRCRECQQCGATFPATARTRALVRPVGFLTSIVNAQGRDPGREPDPLDGLRRGAVADRGAAARATARPTSPAIRTFSAPGSNRPDPELGRIITAEPRQARRRLRLVPELRARGPGAGHGARNFAWQQAVAHRRRTSIRAAASTAASTSTRR